MIFTHNTEEGVEVFLGAEQELRKEGNKIIVEDGDERVVIYINDINKMAAIINLIAEMQLDNLKK